MHARLSESKKANVEVSASHSGPSYQHSQDDKFGVHIESVARLDANSAMECFVTRVLTGRHWSRLG